MGGIFSQRRSDENSIRLNDDLHEKEQLKRFSQQRSDENSSYTILPDDDLHVQEQIKSSSEDQRDNPSKRDSFTRFSQRRSDENYIRESDDLHEQERLKSSSHGQRDNPSKRDNFTSYSQIYYDDPSIQESFTRFSQRRSDENSFRPIRLIRPIDDLHEQEQFKSSSEDQRDNQSKRVSFTRTSTLSDFRDYIFRFLHQGNISPEKENFIKCGKALLGACSEIPQEVLEKYISSNALASRVNNETHPHLWRMLYPHQIRLIIQAPVKGYKDFDITLCYILLRNLNVNVSIPFKPPFPKPTRGWGNEPLATDTTESDDIERIRILQNEVYDILDHPVMANVQFEEFWCQLEDICIRMRIRYPYARNFQNEISHLKTCTFKFKWNSIVETLQENKEINKGIESYINRLNSSHQRQETDTLDVGKLNSGLNRSEQLRETLRERKIHFVGVWVAKRCQSDEEVLVVEVLHSEQYEKLKIQNTPVVYFNAIKSNESLAISFRDTETLRTFSKEEICDAQRVLLQHRNGILKKNSNVVEVEISGHKSKQYGTKGARCDVELTIAIQTRIKGFIPIGEEMFPVKIGKYSTDIREAFVTSATNTPSDLHDPLKIGCSISTRGLLMHSTLGPFFKHPRNGIQLSWSCAHGFIDPDHLSGKGIEFIVPQLIKKPVLQPHGDGNEFGIVYDAKIQHGYDNPGIDGTLIEINSRFPDCGSFPEISKENTLSAGFNDCPTFQNGAVEKEIGKLIGKEVVMFGQKSGFQRGTVQLYDANIEANVVRTTYGNFRYELSQQIKVLPIPIHDPDKGIHFPSPFAILGDSGAPIFIRDGDDLAIVGILTCVGAQGVGYFTPISNFLKAFDIDEIDFFHPKSAKSQPLKHLKCNGVLHKSPTTDQNSNHKNGEDEMDTS